MRSFWLFATNAGDGTEGNPNRPALPAVVGGKWTSPGDVVRLIGRPRDPAQPEPAPFERPDDPKLNQRLEHLAEATGIASPDEMPPGGTGHHHRV